MTKIVRKLTLDFEDYDYDDLFMTPEEVEKTIDNGQFSELWTLFLREFPSANKVCFANKSFS